MVLGSYRYTLHGKETDTETDLQDYGMRIYNPALGRFLSADPISSEYPWNSTYSFAENDVIRCVDIDGLEKYYTIHGEYIGQVGTSTEIRVVNGNQIRRWSLGSLQEAVIGTGDRGRSGQYWINLLNDQSTVVPQIAFDALTDKAMLGPIADGIKQSPTFTELITNMKPGVKISYSTTGTFTEDETGNIYILKGMSTQDQILGLTWELTNSANSERLNGLKTSAVTRDDYIMGKLQIEAEALLIRFQVEKEMGITNDPDASQFYGDINAYNVGAMTKHEITAKIRNWAYDEKSTQVNGKPVLLRDVYGKQYDDIQKNKKEEQKKDTAK